MNQPPRAGMYSLRAELFARLSLAGIALYVVLDIIAQVLPPHYNPISQAESDLAVGPFGVVMAVNFVVRGLLSVAAVTALQSSLPDKARSRAGEFLLSIWAIGAIILAFYPTDLQGQHATVHGLIHLAVALVAFVTGAIGELLLSLRLRASSHMQPIASFSLGIAIIAIIMLLILLVTEQSVIGQHYFGLLERLFLGTVLLWIAVVMARLQTGQKEKLL